MCISHQAPFLDVLGTMQDPSLPLTVEERGEWGDPLTSPQHRDNIASYCPCCNITPQVCPVLSLAPERSMVPSSTSHTHTHTHFIQTFCTIQTNFWCVCVCVCVCLYGMHVQHYPSMLITAYQGDSRVPVSGVEKYVARLRTAVDTHSSLGMLSEYRHTHH